MNPTPIHKLGTDGFKTVLLFDGWKSTTTDKANYLENDVTTELEYKQYCFDRFRAEVDKIKNFNGKTFAKFVNDSLNGILMENLFVTKTNHPTHSVATHLDNLKYVDRQRDSDVTASIAARKFINALQSAFSEQQANELGTQVDIPRMNAT